MRALKIIEHTSLDGVIQSSGENGFPYAELTAGTTTTPTGVILNTYKFAGPLQAA